MTALYQQVCTQILSDIETGQLKVGDRLPPEADYAKDLGVSRSTVRLAFAELEKVGVLSRRKKTGTQIIANSPRQQFNMTTSGVEELLSLGRDTELAVSGTRFVVTEDIPQLARFASESKQWLEVCGSRTLMGDNQPFSVNRVYIPEHFSSIKPLLDNNVTSVFQSIESTFNVSAARVTQSATAIACPTEDAVKMGLEPNAPVLRIDAVLYLQDGHLMEISVATFDPDRFQVHTDVEIQ